MGALVEDAIRAASRALSRTTPRRALEVIRGDATINEAQRAVSRLISVDDRDPEARSRATCATCSRSTT